MVRLILAFAIMAAWTPGGWAPVHNVAVPKPPDPPAPDRPKPPGISEETSDSDGIWVVGGLFYARASDGIVYRSPDRKQLIAFLNQKSIEFFSNKAKGKK